MIAVFLSTNLFAQQEPVVKEIVIRGLRTVKEEDVLRVMQTKVGHRSSPEMRSEDLKAVYALGYFSEDIHFYKEDVAGGIRIIVSVKENPIIEDIHVIGNRKFKAARILASLPFKKGDILPAGAEIKAKLAIEKLYSGGGYKNAKVKVRTEEVEPGKARVSIVVDEGKKILIKDLIIKGNKHYGGFRLRLLLDNKGSWAFVKNYFDETTFDDDIDVLRIFYKNRGFLDVVVKRGKAEYDEEKGWIRPVIIIDEGPRYRVNTVIAKSVTLFTSAEITGCFTELIGRYFSAERYRKAMAKLRRLYGDEGYIQLEVSPDFERLPGKNAISLVLNLRENERIYVGKIKVRRRGYERGKPENFIEKFYDRVAPPPKDNVILREVRLKPKGVYRTFQEVRTVERLKRLEIFKNVSITREPTEKENVRDVVVNVEETPTGNLIFGIGYGESPGAYFQVRYRERNLFGDARDLKVRALLGTRSSAFHIGYLDRYFRDTSTSLEWDLYRDRFRYREYSERVYGTSVEFGKPLSEYVREYVRLRLEHKNFYDEDEDIETDLDSYPVAAVRYRIVEDHRDDVWWPTKGFRRSAGLEVGYADGPLTKLSVSYSYYDKFYKDLIYAVQGYAGLIPYDSDEVGISERFFLGGSTDLRGFAYRGAGPHDKGDHHMALGGSTKLLIKNELRYPIYGDLKGVIFLDAGMLDETVGLASPRASIGTGLRLKISVVRLQIDFAKAILKRHRDDTQFVHFRLGAAF